MGMLDGRVAIVTGAGHGLGLSHATLLAKEGASVVVNDSGIGWFATDPQQGVAEAAAEKVRAAGGTAVAHTGDCSDWDDARRLVDLALESFGRLDILVLNAGIMRERPPHELTEEDWDAVIRVHLKGHFAPAHFAVRHWRELAAAGKPVYGRVIGTASQAAMYGYPQSLPYATAKAGILGFTQTLSQALADIGVTVNAIVPAAITHVLRDTKPPEQVMARLTPENVSPIVAFLASDRGKGVTGQVFNAMGGRFDHFEWMRLVDGVYKADGVWTVEELAAVFDEKLAGGPPPSMQDYFVQTTPIMMAGGAAAPQ